jgi:hypothetical protein
MDAKWLQLLIQVSRELLQEVSVSKRRTLKDYDGWCWPGSSSYFDFSDKMFLHNGHHNDINEPSVVY